MGETTGISWCHHSFNGWWGCQEVGPECDNCYARTFDKRVGGKNWGKDAPRRFFGEKHWAEPLKWAKAAAKAGERRRVFCSSMADVFEDRADLGPEREKLWALIRQTALWCVNCGTFAQDLEDAADRLAHGTDPLELLKFNDGRTGWGCSRYRKVGQQWCRLGGLDWLLLTKRPQNILKMCPPDVVPLIWAGATVGVKKSEWRAAELVKVPSRVRFLSIEPQLEPLNLAPWLTGWSGRGSKLPSPLSAALEQLPELNRIDWVIQGGESGHHARPFDLAWARDLRDQCAAAGVSYFFKQAGADVVETVPSAMGAMGDHLAERRFVDRAGADPAEWPADLRVQCFPEVRP